ncbi:tRNA (guanosine(37)-N1)-methyltransferase TrmD [Candidatus Woesebacteria bacterium RBG_16_36_11]|uniref:tRNA (guanine-N(1)-)-methyltransferase n=2 Tax=Candidatus Woeseibacteriota TaxID=1752722 RepID=A0A1F7X8Q6_9BACT|nr:MAG: tRNA (guanosine(37)-N1)-methyltransferase TrmD [Candidatus Woesebacteria bacterium RBG_16_36_11]
MLKIDILTLFSKMFEGPFTESILGKGQEKKLIDIKVHDIRNWTKDKHKVADDRPYGGGPGMILMIEPLDLAISELKAKSKDKKIRVILMDAAGKTFRQQEAERLSKFKHLILIAGHYKGIDERIKKYLVDEEISIGDYILTGGEIPAMVVTDAITRLIPGVVGKEESLKKESFSVYDKPENPRLLGFPQYTRPESYKGWKVPKVLLSGNHAEIEKWRKEKATEKTKKLRPDLLK